MNADTPLWSYHIWKPEIDPRTELLEYGYTNSGTYQVMPIALGAMAKATVAVDGTATNATNAKALGLYYQWGRKDPLGRSANVDNNSAFVTTYTGATGTTKLDWATAIIDIANSNLLGTDNSITEKEGKAIDVWMLDYVTKHPTQFIKDVNETYNNNWIGKCNDYLWGNPQGYNFPRRGDVHRSIFDPCPIGYRVAPKDLWIGFTYNGQNPKVDTSNEATWAKNIFNILNLSADGKTTTIAIQRGYFFCYEINDDGTKKWQTGNTDFYPTSGYRYWSSGALSNVGSNGHCWCSSPFSSSSNTGGYFYIIATYVNPFSSNPKCAGQTVRCVKE